MTDLSVWTEDEQRARRDAAGASSRGKGGLAVSSPCCSSSLSAVAPPRPRRHPSSRTRSRPRRARLPRARARARCRSRSRRARPSRTSAAPSRPRTSSRASQAFLEVANAEPDASSLQPGFYALQRKMPAADALAAAARPAVRIKARVTLPEGLRLDETLKRLAKDTELPLADYRKALRSRPCRGARAAGLRRGQPRGLPLPGHLRRPAGRRRGQRARGDVRRPTPPTPTRPASSAPSAAPTRSSSSPA